MVISRRTYHNVRKFVIFWQRSNWRVHDYWNKFVLLNEEIPDNSIMYVRYGSSPNIEICQCTRKDIRNRVIWLWKV